MTAQNPPLNTLTPNKMITIQQHRSILQRKRFRAHGAILLIVGKLIKLQRRQKPEQSRDGVRRRRRAVWPVQDEVRAVLDVGGSGRRLDDSDLEMHVSARSFCIGGLVGAESAVVVGDVE